MSLVTRIHQGLRRNDAKLLHKQVFWMPFKSMPMCFDCTKHLFVFAQALLSLKPKRVQTEINEIDLHPLFCLM